MGKARIGAQSNHQLFPFIRSHVCAEPWAEGFGAFTFPKGDIVIHILWARK